MSGITYQQLLPDIASADKLILNGIGEPLMHPDLEEMVRAARSVMQESAVIGFQTNGHLLSGERAQRLVDAGLNSVCFSLDSLAVYEDDKGDGEPSVDLVIQAIDCMQTAARLSDRTISIGLEVVLNTTNIDELGSIINWSTKNGIDYILVTHLFPYDTDMARNSLFTPHCREALEIFAAGQGKAREQGLELVDWLKGFKRFANEPISRSVRNIFKEMTQQAASKGVRLHWESLFAYDPERADNTRQIFAAAQEQARLAGISLSLPELSAREKRQCPFIRDHAVFISYTGEVMPCHFLWHSYPCMAGTGLVMVQERSFGNVEETRLRDIWSDESYVQFRQDAGDDNFSSCWTCPQGPCENLINANILGAHDCYGSGVPCGHCLWSLGALQCM